MLNELLVFGKAQVSAFFGGMIDYFLMIFITEVFGVPYPVSIGISGIAGALVNFSVNRYWTFSDQSTGNRSSLVSQVTKFGIVVLNSILLKSYGTWLFTNLLDIDYKFARIMTDIPVSWLVNYNLQRRWVFKKRDLRHSLY